MRQSSTPRLNQDQRDEITRRVLAGETAVSLGMEFGVTRAYVALLKAQALDPERFIRKREAKLSRKLTAAEIKKFCEMVADSTPEDHDLVPTSERWSYDHGRQLAAKVFPNKHPSVRVIKECMAPYVPRPEDFRFTKPQAPKPHHINQISPELAKDPDYVAYYLSPICEQIAWREYELALADWNARFADAEEAETESPTDNSDRPPAAMAHESFVDPGERTGKHARSKGSPFTPPKRRKKR